MTPRPHVPMHTAVRLAVLACATLVAACGGAGEAGSDQAAGSVAPSGDIRVTGFSTPESVLHDEVADVYLVSNILGGPLEKDGNGFISRLSPEGEVLDLRWIDGRTEGITLNAPKGMAIDGNRLYVADIDCLRVFDRESGDQLDNVCLANATFLNDVAVTADGSIFFTDSGLQPGPDGFLPSGTDAVYRLIDRERVVAVKKETSLGAPNGIAVGARGILVATFGSGEVYRLDAEGNRTNMMPPSKRQLDGIFMLPDGGFMMSSWGDRAVYRIGADGAVTKVIENVDAPADIGYDALRDRVLVPLFNDDAVLIHPLG